MARTPSASGSRPGAQIRAAARTAQIASGSLNGRTITPAAPSAAITQMATFARAGGARTAASAVAAGLDLVVGLFPADGVEHLGVAGLLELVQRLAAHSGIDVQVGDAGHRRQLLQHEEDRAILHHGAPVAAADHVALLVA